MKTLDEVIDYCEGKQTCGEWVGIADVLHYLKMYRSDMQMYAENQKYWEDELKQKIKDFGDAKERYIKRLKELDIGTLNDPLSWEELKQMEGKPVWIKSQTFGAWYLILDFDVDNDMMLCVGRFYERLPLHRDRMGKTWQAYRKEK